MGEKIIIAIDGTAASGKGTLARRLAAHFDFAWLDTGLLYRRVALTLLQQGKTFEDSQTAITIARSMDQKDLNDPDLRGADAGRGASIVGAIPGVRGALFDFQRSFPIESDKRGAVIDGRDIGTVIFPDANIKFFVDAKPEIRAARRHAELAAKGDPISFGTVLNDFHIRDARDSGRPNAPLRAAPDAVKIDTSSTTPDQVFEMALAALARIGL